MCQGKGNRMPLHDFWALGTSNAEHSGFCCFAQNNILHSKPRPSALHNNSFCAIWLTASDTKLPGCLTCTSGSCILFLLHLISSSRWETGSEFLSPKKCTEKFKKVIRGVLKQINFLQNSPSCNTITQKTWEAERKEEEHFHEVFRWGLSWLYCLMKTSKALTIPLMSRWEMVQKGMWGAGKDKGRAEEGGKEIRKWRERFWQSLKAEDVPTELVCRQ